MVAGSKKRIACVGSLGSKSEGTLPSIHSEREFEEKWLIGGSFLEHAHLDHIVAALGGEVPPSSLEKQIIRQLQGRGTRRTPEQDHDTYYELADIEKFQKRIQGVYFEVVNDSTYQLRIKGLSHVILRVEEKPTRRSHHSLEEAVIGMLDLFRQYSFALAGQDTDLSNTKRYSFRLREDGQTRLTFKYNRRTDGKYPVDANIEPQVLVNRAAADHFLFALGFVHKKRGKLKDKITFEVKDEFRTYKCEINKIPRLGYATFLEIECVDKLENEADVAKGIYEIAKMLGVPKPHKILSEGGLRAPDGYMHYLKRYDVRVQEKQKIV